MAAEPACGDEFSDAYRKCEATVSELQMQVSVFNDSVTKLTRQVSRCSAIHEEAFFHQYVRSLLQQLSKLATPVSACIYFYRHDISFNKFYSCVYVHSLVHFTQLTVRYVF